MTVQARWPTLVVGWALAVAVTALIAWRAVNFVGSQFSSDVAISRPRAAAQPTPGAGPGSPTPQRTPAVASGQPSPPTVREPDVPQPAPTPPRQGGGTDGPIALPPIRVPVVPPVPVPQPNPQPVPSPQPPDAEPPDDDDGGPVVALPPPFVPAPDVAPPPSPEPQFTPVPIRISDRRAVETAGGMAIFTCTNGDVVALENAAAAPGYEVGPVRLREDSRMDVFFVGTVQEDQRIDARCRDGALDTSVESDAGGTSTP